MSDLTAEDRDYWGVTDEVDAPMPETRTIGQRFYIRHNGERYSVTFRVHPDKLGDAMNGGAKDQFEAIVNHYGDEKLQAWWPTLDIAERLILSAHYFEGFAEFTGEALGE